jgi:surface protein
VTTFKDVFSYCSSLTNLNGLENWDTSSLTSLDGAFRNCASLTDASAIGDWDTSNVTVMSSLFYDCKQLHKLPLIDCSSVTSIGSFFGYSNINTLTDLGGFTGLKLYFDGLSKCPNLTVQSLLNVFNTIADVNGLGTRTLTIGSTNLNKLTDDQKAIAINKGWTLK